MFHCFLASMSNPPSIEEIAWYNSDRERKHVDSSMRGDDYKPPMRQMTFDPWQDHRSMETIAYCPKNNRKNGFIDLSGCNAKHR